MGKKKTDGDEPRNDGRVFREAEIVAETRDAGDGKTETIVRATVSSETPYPRTMWDEENKAWVRGHEVLGHAKGEIDESRMKDGLVIQDTHWGDQIGIIRKPELKDGKLGGVIEFGCGERALEIARDAAAGIRRNMSVGYIVREYKKVGKAEDGLPIFRVTKWTPYEASFVNVPADTNIGVGRVADTTDEGRGGAVRAAVVEPSAVTPKEKEMDAKTIAALMAQAERAHMKTADVTAMIEAGKTEAEIRSEIAERACAYADELAKKTAQPEPQKKTAIFDGGDERKIVKEYNLLNVIRALAKDGSPDVGFEREISDQIAKAQHKDARGFYIPEAVLVRAITGKTNVSGEIVGNGAATVETSLLASQYIDELVATTVLGAAGVQTVGGLVGDIAIPKGTAVTAGWISEKDNATTKTPTFSQVPGTPHTAAANAILSRRLVIQSSLAVQNLVARLIMEAIGRAVEAAAFDGTGTNNQPTGLSATTGVGAVTMTAGAPTKANLVDFWEKVYTANAAGANMKYIGSPAVKALLCKTLDITTVSNGKAGDSAAIVGGVGAGYLCSKDAKVEGFDFLMSALCNSKKLYFGNWAEILMCFWSGVDMIVDPYTYSAKGAWQVTAFQDCDVIVRHPAAFAIGTALS
jgi:HK97 family phage major capsid protein